MGRLTKILQLPTEIQTTNLRSTRHQSKFTQSLLVSKHGSGGIPQESVSKSLSLSLSSTHMHTGTLSFITFQSGNYSASDLESKTAHLQNFIRMKKFHSS